jgi:N-acetylglucosaminyldiphosphoundecaprenol N-acetyl-beta-D-mannosaminyltransferase
MKRVPLGRIHADAVTFAEAIDRIAGLVAARRGGYVVTPNIDHVVLAERDDELARAYARASLSLVDGTARLWVTGLLGHRLPEKVSGADLIRPLLARGAAEGWRVYLLGGAPGVAERASAALVAELPKLCVAGVDAPPRGFERQREGREQVLARLRAARPDLVLVALGCPKQEILMRDWRDAMAPAVAIGIGAGLDFIAGQVRRAPAWMSRLGFEWAFRLAQEPRRLAYRYLVRDPAIIAVVWRSLRSRRTRGLSRSTL